MKQTIAHLIFTIICLFSAPSVSAETSDAATISSISTVPLNSSNKNFSLHITFTPNQTFEQWALGFYMPRTFKKLGTSINPNLTMQICETSTPSQCKDLQLISIKNKKQSAFYTAGYSTVLTIKNNVDFPLQKGKTYKINLNNSDQGAPKKIYTMPQNIFFIDNFAQQNETAYLITVPLPALKMGGYSPQKIAQQVETHLVTNWRNSKPMTRDLMTQHKIIPAPTYMQSLDMPGFKLKYKETLTLSGSISTANLTLLKNYLQKDLNKTLRVTPKKDADIVVSLSNIIFEPEEYEIIINKKYISITARTNAGVFYALQTLRQLWFVHPDTLPALQITDIPRFKYRGILLDTARHYFSVPQIKNLLDAMAALKFNTLHLHVSDDEGFRIKLNSLATLGSDVIKKASVRGYFPDSTMSAALYQQANFDLSNYKAQQPPNPKSTLIETHYPDPTTRYQGLYTKAEIVDLIKYANTRQITIIPEIDLPGHARALVHAAPSVFIDPNDKSQYISVQGYDDDVIPVCLYEKKTTQGQLFTRTINRMVTEINNLFDKQTTVYFSPEVSVGGDEVPISAWTDDRSCNGQWKNLSALDKSQYFFRALQKNTGVKLSGWQQIVQKDNPTSNTPAPLGKHALQPNNVKHVYVWNPVTPGVMNGQVLAGNDYPTVFAFADDTYFDLAYTPDSWEPGFTWATDYSDTYAALHSAVDINQVLDKLPFTKRKYVFGLEGTLWTENINNFRHLSYMALPKMTGLAEAAWSERDITTNNNDKINWQSLAYRLGTDHNGILGYLYKITGMHYRGYPYGIRAEIPRDTVFTH